MSLEQVAHAGERVLRLNSVGPVNIASGQLVKLSLGAAGLIMSCQNDAALLAEDSLADYDWLCDVVSRKCYIAELVHAQPGIPPNPGKVTLRILEFDGFEHWVRPFVAGVDERTVEDVNRFRGRDYSSTEVIDWLSGELTFNAVQPRFVVAAGLGQVSQDAFRVLGANISADIRAEHGKFLVVRVARKPANRRAKCILISGTLEIVDHTRVGLVSDEERAELRRLADAEDAFLRIWRDYSRLEQQAKRQAAEEIGWAQYDRYRIRADGSIEFYLVANAMSAALIERVSDGLVGLEASLSRSYLVSEGEGDGVLEGERRRVFGFAIGDARITTQDTIILTPDRPVAAGDLPAKGEIYGAYITDAIRISRRDWAQRELALAKKAPSRQLGLILAKKSPDPVGRVQRHEPISARVRAALGGEPTPAQMDAIDLAINSRDVVLIQGPPGTGKTKVIAAIQARLSELSEGQLAGNRRVLLASHQHDAVENLVLAVNDGALPAVKIGSRSHGGEDDSHLRVWVADLRARLDDRYKDHVPSELLRNLRQARDRVTSYRIQPLDVAGTIELLKWVSGATRLIDASIASEATETAKTLERDIGGGGASREFKEAERLARGLRTTIESFDDDGLQRARGASLHSTVRELLSDQECALLDAVAIHGDSMQAPRLAVLQRIILDRILDHRAATSIVAARPEVEALLFRAVDALESAVRAEASDIDLAIEDFRNAVLHQAGSVQRSLRAHTRALAATCQQAVSGAMQEVQPVPFSTVIVDEAARANPLDLMIPMALASDRIILVGDHRQLPQLLDDQVLSMMNGRHDPGVMNAVLTQSMFENLFASLVAQERMDGIRRAVTLDRQFRMHPTLGSFISRNFYEPFGEVVANGFEDASMFAHGLPTYDEKACGWIDVPHAEGKELRQGTSLSRPVEASRIADELASALSDSQDLSFGVITFYAGQVEAIWRALDSKGLAMREENEWKVNPSALVAHTDKGLPRFRVGTVDAFQGREFDVVYLSSVRSSGRVIRDARTFGFLTLPNRLNVAMSRQRRLLIVVGDAAHLASDLGREAVPALANFYDLTGGEDGFRR